jgi:hypothetical protein
MKNLENPDEHSVGVCGYASQNNVYYSAFGTRRCAVSVTSVRLQPDVEKSLEDMAEKLQRSKN